MSVTELRLTGQSDQNLIRIFLTRIRPNVRVENFFNPFGFSVERSTLTSPPSLYINFYFPRHHIDEQPEIFVICNDSVVSTLPTQALCAIEIYKFLIRGLPFIFSASGTSSIFRTLAMCNSTWTIYCFALGHRSPCVLPVFSERS